eukprot:2302080-Prymnesium_polylepis.2
MARAACARLGLPHADTRGAAIKVAVGLAPKVGVLAEKFLDGLAPLRHLEQRLRREGVARRVVDARRAQPAPLEQICRAEARQPHVDAFVLLGARRVQRDHVGPARLCGATDVQIVSEEAAPRRSRAVLA